MLVLGVRNREPYLYEINYLVVPSVDFFSASLGKLPHKENEKSSSRNTSKIGSKSIFSIDIMDSSSSDSSEHSKIVHSVDSIEASPASSVDTVNAIPVSQLLPQKENDRISEGTYIDRMIRMKKEPILLPMRMASMAHRILHPKTATVKS